MTWAGRCGAWGATVAVLAWLAGCAPALDWRDTRPAGSSVTLQFPCRPITQERSVALAGPPVRLALLACTADGQTWALAFADMADPARVGPALLALRRAAAGNVDAADAAGAMGDAALPLLVPGATPNAAAGRVRLAGSLPAEAAGAARTPVQMQLAVFAHGTQVYQATVLGARVADDAADVFFGSLHAGAVSTAASPAVAPARSPAESPTPVPAGPAGPAGSSPAPATTPAPAPTPPAAR